MTLAGFCSYDSFIVTVGTMRRGAFIRVSVVGMDLKYVMHGFINHIVVGFRNFLT